MQILELYSEEKRQQQKHQTNYKMSSPLECFNCKKSEQSVNSLIQHLRKHNVLPYKCAMPQCVDKIFGNTETIRSHLKKHLETSTSACSEPENPTDFEQLFDECLADDLNQPENAVQGEILKKLSSLRHDFLRIFLPIFGNENIARKQSIESTKSLCEHFKKSLDLIKESLSYTGMDIKDKVYITDIIAELKTSVDIRSEYMLLKELERSQFFVRSQFVEFARKQEQYLTPENEIAIRDLIFGVSIFPLQPAFYKLFNHTNILHEILKYKEEVEKSPTIINYMQGNFF